MGYFVKQSQTAQPLVFLMVLSSDHVSPATGLTPTVTLSKNGAAFASPAGAVSEIGNGWYKVAGNATDTGTLGPLLLHATGTGADPSDDRFDVVAFDPQAATNLGLSALPTANPAASGGLPTCNASGNVGADLQTIKTQTVTCAAGVTVNPNVGTTQAIVFDANNLPKVDLEDIRGAASTGAAGYVGIDWGQITNKSTINLLSQTQIASMTGNVGGSVLGSVSSVLGNVSLSFNDSPKLANGLTLAGSTTTNLAVNTSSFTANALIGCVIRVQNAGFTDQFRVITSNDSSATGNIGLDRALTNAPPSGQAFYICGAERAALNASLQPTAASVAGNVGGNVVGSVSGNVGGNVVGSVGSVTGPVTVGTNNDKSGYTLAAFGFQVVLTSGEHTAIASDVQTGLTAQGYTTTRAGYLDTLNGLVSAIWNAATSGMTAVGSIGKKLAGWVLGSDSKVLLSTDAQTGVVIPTVTTVFSVTAIGSGGITASSFAAGSIAATTIDTTFGNRVADHVRRRQQTNVEASTYGDAISVNSEYGMIQSLLESSTADFPGFLTIYQTDAATIIAKKTITTDAGAVPVTSIK